jgi:predicted secreted hydrolase
LQKNYTTEKRTAGGGSDSGGQEKFLFNDSGWLMSGVNGTDQLKANSDQFAFDLKLETTRPPILHGNNGKQLMNTGTLTRDSITEILPDTGIHLTPLETWTSKSSGLIYPILWKLELPSKNINLTTKAIVNNSEFDARLTTCNIYWE